MMAGFLYASLHQRDKIDPRIFQYHPNDVIDADAAYWIASIYALLGETKPALDWLRRAVALGDTNYPWLQRDKNFDSLRGSPDFQNIVSGIRTRYEAGKKAFGDAP